MSDTARIGGGLLANVGDWIARVGVPATIAFILLTQIGPKLDDISKKLERLTVLVEMKEVHR